MAVMQENELENNDKSGSPDPGVVLEEENSPGPDVEAEAENNEFQQKLELLERQAKENLDKALRAQAELDNVRKRSSRDVENAHKYALEKFANDLLPILDSMELGINAIEASDENQTLREGMELTLKMFSDVLEKYGIEQVQTEGEKFDPEKHEAVTMQEKDGSESGDIVSVFQKGYLLNGRLIRPAMVIVAS